MKAAMGLGPLKYRNFRLLWTSWMIAAIASWVHQVVIMWLIFELTNSPLMLGMTGIFMSVPFLITSLYGGALADRMDRRKLLLIAQVIITLLAVVPGVLSALNVIQVWHLYTLSFLSWTVSGFDGPARQALVPGLVPRGELMRAIALTSAVRRSTALVGPMIGGIGISLVGVTGSFFVYAGLHGLVLFALLLMKTPPMEAQSRKISMTHSILEGLRSVLDNRILWGILSLEAAHTFFVSYQALMPVFARDILNVGPTGLGLLYSSPGVGALIGSGLAIAMGDVKKKGRLFSISAFSKPLALIFFAFSTWMPISMLILVFAGVFDILGGTIRNTMLQLSTHERLRGRVMSMNMMVHRGLGPLSGLQSGFLASLIGAPWAVAGGSVFFIIFGTILLLRVPVLYRYPQGVPQQAPLPNSDSEQGRSGL